MEVIICLCIIALIVLPLVFPEDNTCEHIAKIVEDIQDKKNDKYK